MAKEFSCRPSQLLEVEDRWLAFCLDEALFYKLKQAEEPEGAGLRLSADGRATTLGIPDDGSFPGLPPADEILREIPIEAGT